MLSNLKNRGLNSYELKWIAIVTMLLDHIYKIFYVFLIPIIEKTFHIDEMGSYFLILLLFGIGSVTMTIFAWFIAEGCRYTHNIKVYIVRLLLFGILSEVPFQLMSKVISMEPLSLKFGFTNIMFTLALGVISCYGYQFFQDKNHNILKWCVPISCVATAYLLHTDYGAFGVLAIFLCYVIKNKKTRLLSLASLIFLFRGLIYPVTDFFVYGFDVGLIITHLILLGYTLISIFLLSLYNEERGKKSKYFFYIFYPLHMVVLVIIFTLIQ